MTRIIDLTLPIKHGDRGIEIAPARSLEKDGWNAATLKLYSHCGTHIDAPLHFGIAGTIDDVDPQRLVGPAWLIDIDPVIDRMEILVEHLRDVKDKFMPLDSLVIRTGWSRYYGMDKYRHDLPRVSEQLASWCADNGCNMLGVEPPSVGDVNNIEKVTAVHRILLEAGIIIIEGLANLQSITCSKFTLAALPLKIAGGDGAPGRVIAIEDH